MTRGDALGADAAGSPPLVPGAELAGYRIVSLIGRGGMGVVYRALSASPTRPLRALLVLLTSYSGTPSVTTTVSRLCRGRLVECGRPSAKRLDGFSGVELDGETKGAGMHFLIPFTPPSRRAAGDGAADLIELPGAHPFHVAVVDVRGRTVFVLTGSLVLSPDAFTAFLPEAQRLLRSIRFPR